MKENTRKKTRIGISIIFIVVSGFFLPKITKKIKEEVYKRSQEEIDFDDFNPEIVRKDIGGK